MQNNKTNTILLIILILLVVVVAWVMYGNKDKNVTLDSSEVTPSGYTQTTNNPTGNDYQPSTNTQTPTSTSTSSVAVDSYTGWKSYDYRGITFKYPPTWNVSINRDRLYGQDPNDQKIIGLTISPPGALVSSGNYPTNVSLQANQYSSEHDTTAFYSIIVDGAYLGSAAIQEEAYPTTKVVKDVYFSLGNGSQFMTQLKIIFDQIVASVK